MSANPADYGKRPLRHAHCKCGSTWQRHASCYNDRIDWGRRIRMDSRFARSQQGHAVRRYGILRRGARPIRYVECQCGMIHQSSRPQGTYYAHRKHQHREWRKAGLNVKAIDAAVERAAANHR